MDWIYELPSPAVLIEERRLAHNLRTMQARAAAAGVRLRPHTKTHKSVELARRQLDLGASGLTVAKPGEAEVFFNAGLNDVRLAYTPVSRDALERLANLSERGRISFCIDTSEGLAAASEVFLSRGQHANVLVEIDVGYGRCGIHWQDPDLMAFLAAPSSTPAVELVGILTHAGHAYNGPGPGETKEGALKRVMEEERDRMIDVAVRAKAAGLHTSEDFDVSVGSTPSMRYFENASRDGCTVTEIRPGNYVFHDATQQAIGAATWDECALTIQATVISRHRNSGGSERLFLDAGKKVFTSDRIPGTDEYGTLMYNPRVMEPLPHARLNGLSEEHGWIRVRGGATMTVGDRVRAVPAHACVVVNTQDQVYVVDGEQVKAVWQIDARGRVN